MYRDLTRGSILRSLLLFALPMLAGDILQQLYNIADTLIVSRAIGRDALAAVGSAYTLMIFLTSILLGLSMGAGAVFSICRGRGDESGLRQSIVHAFALIGVLRSSSRRSPMRSCPPFCGFCRCRRAFPRSCGRILP